ncbi:hypothetical protein OOU_Y34scaffold00979g23 [Pyricularia oryzae Y34]|uniref:Uncharacterized protein n=1 Tax=Pyricularia oryzae (strain Y34) TaxID=1143189 RepID=A0AA97NN69_PYRO3|nr:hypothetical protein OOU_Y34scaffold00979g23 [Pyricularia oryzae Y34]
MMSGIEVPGTVLGAIPIALLALDGYKRAAKKANLFISIRKEYVSCEKQLQFHQVSIKKHLRQLLLPLFQDEDDRLGMLLSNPGGEDWKHKDVTRLLERQLGDSCDLCLGYLADMRDILVEIGKELSFQSPDTRQKLHQKRLFKELSDLYAKLDYHGESTGKRVWRTRITEGSEDEQGCVSIPLANVSPEGTVVRAALRHKSLAGRSRPATPRVVQFSQPSQTVTLTVQNCDKPTTLPLGPIKVLCTLMKPPPKSSPCKGYLGLPNDERKYYVYTMEDDLPMCPDSPYAFDKDSVLFLAGKLDEPHISRAFSTLTEAKQNPTDGVSAPLSRLGNTLLELCFGTTLQSQELRKSLPSGDTERMRDLFDVTATCEWLKDVAEDRGEDYAGAVTWCLVGHRSGLGRSRF